MSNESYKFCDKATVGFQVDSRKNDLFNNFLNKNIDVSEKSNNYQENLINILTKIGSKAIVEDAVYKAVITSSLIANNDFENINDFFSKADYIYNKVISNTNKKYKKLSGGTLDFENKLAAGKIRILKSLNNNNDDILYDVDQVDKLFSPE